MNFFIASLIVFSSGAIALAYEILWNRVLTNALGATIFVNALVVTTFFVALSIGSNFLRRWNLINRAPWLAFSYLQIGIAIGLLPAVFISLFDIYPGAGIASGWIKIIVQIFTAVALVGPATFLMGGTLLALIEATHGTRLKNRASLLYGINTLGGIIGIITATFYIIYLFGIRINLFVFMALSVGLASVAFACHLHYESKTIRVKATPKESSGEKHSLTNRIPAPFWLIAISAISGATILGFEVLLFHAYAQVGQNSAWSFGAILILIISSLGISAILASVIRISSATALRYLLPLISFGLILFPKNFYLITRGLESISLPSGSLEKYMINLFRVGIMSCGPLLFLSGLVFPCSLNISNLINKKRISLSIGRLLAANSIGAVCGVMGVQWILVPYLGIWKSSSILGVLPLIGWFILERKLTPLPKIRHFSTRALAIGAAALLVFSLAQNLPQIMLGRNEEIVELKTGPEGIVCIRKTRDNIWRMSVNNSFILSTNASTAINQRMSHIPLLLHPNPSRVGYIGLATGLTASGATQHKRIESITVLEISPLVIELSLKHFGQFTNNFQRDERVNILEEDGVHFFATTTDTFEVIIGDVFFPWREGVNRLYSYEHFTHIYRRLSDGGIFCQWFPLHHLDKDSFSLIARTFKRAFPDSIILRLPGEKRYIALVGIKNGGSGCLQEYKNTWLNRKAEENLKDNLLKRPFLFEAMVLGEINDFLKEEGPINTLNRPILEPIAIRLEPTLAERNFGASNFLSEF